MLCGKFGFIFTLESLKDFKHDMVRFLILPTVPPSFPLFLIIILVVGAGLEAC